MLVMVENGRSYTTQFYEDCSVRKLNVSTFGKDKTELSFS